MAEKEDSQKIRSNVIIEILGKPKEHVEEAMKMYLQKIKDDDNDIVIMNEKTHSAEEQKDGFFSTFTELDIVSEGLSALIGFCFDYMPSSVEIITPEELKMTHRETTNIINDLQTKLHNLDMVIKTTKSENDFLRRNMNTAVRNLVMVSLKHKPMGLGELSKITGIKDNELKIFMDTLIKLEKIKEENGLYHLKNE